MTLEVKPLSLENALRLALLVAPYVARIEKHWPKLRLVLEGKGESGPLGALLGDLRPELAMLPGDMVVAFALCLDVDPEFVTRNAKAEDLLNALPVLDSINGGFVELWRTYQAAISRK